jgi:hypothetical protein
LKRKSSSKSRQVEIMKWLPSHGILHSGGMLKPQLCTLIQIHKPRAQKYLDDHILPSHRHGVLHLPPYHPDLHWIEMKWSQVERWVASRNITFKAEDVKMLCGRKSDEIRGEWFPVCDHVKRTEKGTWNQRELST